MHSNKQTTQSPCDAALPKCKAAFTVKAKDTAVYSAPAVAQTSGVYTITEEKNGYGKLKFGAG